MSTRKYLGLITFLIALSIGAFGQATMTSSGNWTDPTKWVGSNIGDGGESVTINSSVSPVVPNGSSFTIGPMVFNNDNTLTIDATGSLTVGGSGNPQNVTTANNANFVVSGTLEIWGDLIANQNLNLNISGVVHIHGNLTLSSVNTNAVVNGSGQLIVDGNVTGGDNVNFTVNGSVNVGGTVSVGAGSNLGGTGTFHVNGSCTGPGSFCGSGTLPVELVYFRFERGVNKLDLLWATASEQDVDYFAVEKSRDGKVFFRIGAVPATGGSLGRDYTLSDEKPSVGASYYPLKEVGRNGLERVLDVIRPDFDGTRYVSLSPNPVAPGQLLSIQLNFQPKAEVLYTVIDLSGRVVFNFESRLELNEVSIALDPGAYIIRSISDGSVTAQRLLVSPR